MVDAILYPCAMQMVDFDDIIGLTVEMLRRYPTLRDRLRLRYPHVLVSHVARVRRRGWVACDGVISHTEVR